MTIYSGRDLRRDQAGSPAQLLGQTRLLKGLIHSGLETLQGQRLQNSCEQPTPVMDASLQGSSPLHAPGDDRMVFPTTVFLLTVSPFSLLTYTAAYSSSQIPALIWLLLASSLICSPLTSHLHHIIPYPYNSLLLFAYNCSWDSPPLFSPQLTP